MAEPAHGPASGWSLGLLVFGVVFLVVAHVWALLALSIPLDDGRPCGGDGANLAQKLIAGSGFVLAWLGVAFTVETRRGRRRLAVAAMTLAAGLTALLAWLGLMFVVIDC